MARVLLVDDEESILRSISVLLKTEGHEVDALDSGAEALDLVRTKEYDLLITDIRMIPVDGMELMKAAREQQPSLPMIVISAYSSEKTAELSYELGCVAYLAKPFKIEDVLDAIQKALGPGASGGA